jgi:hypothetical protein
LRAALLQKTRQTMLSGFKTFGVGLALAAVPQIVSYVSSFDFVHACGLSPNAATAVGLLMIALRAVTTSPIFKK